MKATLLNGILSVTCDGTGGSVLVTRGKIINIYVERQGQIVQAGTDAPLPDPANMAKPIPPIIPQPASAEWHQAKVDYEKLNP